MPDTKHTPGPWETVECTIWPVSGEGSFPVAETASHWNKGKPSNSEGFEYANAKRIVACVNACAGINPEVVPELLEACNAFVECFHCKNGDCTTCEVPPMVREAIKKATL